jgi:phage baseplate assembly protein W
MASMSITTPQVWVTGIAELEQSIALFFTTPKYSVPLQPWQGNGVTTMVDRNISSILKLIAEAHDGLAIWDNRIQVVSILPNQNEKGITVQVKWKVAGDTIIYDTII